MTAPRSRVVPSVQVQPPDLYADMNGTERDYAITLEARYRNGEIAAWRFEKVTLKLADDTRYTPDFWVVYPTGRVEFIEVKGFWRDDARVKIRVAAAQFPEFAFHAARKDRGGWQIESFSPVPTTGG
jgi:hypothetical protein